MKKNEDVGEKIKVQCKREAQKEGIHYLRQEEITVWEHRCDRAGNPGWRN